MGALADMDDGSMVCPDRVCHLRSISLWDAEATKKASCTDNHNREDNQKRRLYRPRLRSTASSSSSFGSSSSSSRPSSSLRQFYLHVWCYCSKMLMLKSVTAGTGRLYKITWVVPSVRWRSPFDPLLKCPVWTLGVYPDAYSSSLTAWISGAQRSWYDLLTAIWVLPNGPPTFSSNSVFAIETC